MIDYLCGDIVKRHSKGIVLNVCGVGYGIELPLGALCDVKIGAKSQTFWIYTRVREDQLKLYGFKTWEEKEVFEILISLNGVGPKVALAILSTMSLGILKNCVEDKRVDLLMMVPGIGKRTAEKMLVELQAKVEKFASLGELSSFSQIVTQQGALTFLEPKDDVSARDEISETINDVKSALINLGFKEKDIVKVSAIKNFEVSDEVPDGSREFSELLRKSLVELRGSFSVSQAKKASTGKGSDSDAVNLVDETSLF